MATRWYPTSVTEHAASAAERSPAVRPNSRRASRATTSTDAPPASAFGNRVIASGAHPRREPTAIDAAISHFINIGCSTSSPENTPCR